MQTMQQNNMREKKTRQTTIP